MARDVALCRKIAEGAFDYSAVKIHLAWHQAMIERADEH
jgi:hypothetical protein